MSMIDDRTAEIDAWLDGELSEAAAEELERWLCADAGRMEQFVEVSFLHQTLREAVLTQKSAELAGEEGLDSDRKQPQPALTLALSQEERGPDSNSPLSVSIILDPSPLGDGSTPLYVAHPFLFSNIFSLLVLCVGILGAWFYQIEIPRQTARNDRQATVSRKASNKSSPASQLEFVGRVTGMADVEWADEQTATLHGANVPLGRKYALASGLMEITYKTGAKVILQGPCVYKVESSDGGFLAIGKLTARLEKKRSAVSDQRSEKVASGPVAGGSVASENNLPSPGHRPQVGRERGQNTNPQSQISNPLFAIRTPTAVVTDLGTEFGVEVDRNGRTFTTVFVGEVMATSVPTEGKSPESIHLVAGQSAAIDSEHLSDATPTPQKAAKRFVRVMPAPPVPLKVLARDEANRPAYLSGWHNGDWSGDGWDSGWSVTQDKNCFCFIESARGNDLDPASDGKALIDIEQKSFGLRSKGDIASAVRTFGFQDLPINATFAIDLDTGHPGPGSMGFGLLNSADEWRIEFALEYEGSTYTVHDGLATSKLSGGLVGLDTGVHCTDKGLRVEVTRLDIDAYRLKIVRLSDKREYVFDRRFVDRPGGKEISKLRVWNYSLKDTPERSMYFNRISVTVPRDDAK